MSKSENLSDDVITDFLNQCSKEDINKLSDYINSLEKIKPSIETAAINQNEQNR